MYVPVKKTGKYHENDNVLLHKVDFTGNKSNEIYEPLKEEK
jgi:hypothetical protein